MDYKLSATALILALGMVCSAQAEEGKRYNFSTRPLPVETSTEQESAADIPIPVEKTSKPEESNEVVGDVSSPNENRATSERLSIKNRATKNTEKAERLVRFFIGSCFKFYGRNDDMIQYMDDHFPRLGSDRKADVAPIVNGSINTQYWTITLNDDDVLLAKDTSSGKCDVITENGESTAVHKELRAVMDGLTITKIVETRTRTQRIRKQNKEVSIVTILGHPLEKEMGIVATTRIKETGDSMAAILTLFTVPQETVEIK